MLFHKLQRAAREEGENGSVLVDFALALIPFLFIVMTIIEVSLMLVTQQVLDARVNDAARMITGGGLLGETTGQAAARIRSTVCGANTLVLISAERCNSELLIDVRAVSAGSTIPAPIANGSINAAAFSVSSTGGASILLVRVGITLPQMSPFWSTTFNNLGDGRRLLVSEAIAKVDPFAEYNSTGSSATPVF